MEKVRMYIEIMVNGEWCYITPIDCLMLDIPCPKHPSSVFKPRVWDYAVDGNPFLLATVTGEKNPHNLIHLVGKEHIIMRNDVPSDMNELIREFYDLALALESRVYAQTVFKGSVFLDTEYWDQELYDGSMKLKYRDLVQDFDKWVGLCKGLEKEFDDYRLTIWIEDT